MTYILAPFNYLIAWRDTIYIYIEIIPQTLFGFDEVG